MCSWSRWRQGIALVISLVGVLSMLLPASPAIAAPCWHPPVVGDVVDPFRAPPCTWCAGNRGIEFRVGSDVEVRTAASGTVSFAGAVAGVDYVVVDIAGGWKLTYGRMTSSEVGVGRAVIAGQVIGRASRTFYFGLRIDGLYADPAPFIGTVQGRHRLVPVDGTPAHPVTATTVRCQGHLRRR